MDFAPFKKPSRLAGLFSYRSVIPPSPHKTLLRKFLRGPRRPAGRQTCKRHIACDDFFAKSSRAHSAAPSRPKSRRICGGWPRNAPAGAVASPENPAARVFPGPRRPVLHSKRPALRPGVSCAAGAKSSNPEPLAPLSEHFSAPSPHFCPACRRKLWHYSQLRTRVFVWYDDPRNIKQERNLKICLRTNGKA